MQFQLHDLIIFRRAANKMDVPVKLSVIQLPLGVADFESLVHRVDRFPQRVVIISSDAVEVQVAEGESVSDDSGTRQARVFVAPGTVATLILPDGSEQELTEFKRLTHTSQVSLSHHAWCRRSTNTSVLGAPPTLRLPPRPRRPRRLQRFPISQPLKTMASAAKNVL